MCSLDFGPRSSSWLIAVQGVNHWKSFFSDHKSYTRVGRVSHPPIDPMSPVPEPCQPPKDNKGEAKSEKTKRTGSTAKDEQEKKGHTEL
jgi:hypothetical protein